MSGPPTFPTQRNGNTMKPLTAFAALALSCLAVSAAEYAVVPDTAVPYAVLRDGRRYLHVGNVAWGPNWAWFGLRGEATVADGQRLVSGETTIGGTQHTLALRHAARQTAPDRVVLDFELSAVQDAQLTAVVVTLEPAQRLARGGKALAVSADGTTREIALPFGGPAPVGESVSRIDLVAADGATISVAIDPPRTVTVDGAARIELLGASIRAGEARRTTLTLTLPSGTTFYPDKEATLMRTDTTGWFPYPTGPAGVPIDLSFLNKDAGGSYVPAGAHGFLGVRDGEFVFEDGTPARFWGLNVTAGAALSSPERAAQLAERLARMGMNIVRLHHLDSWHDPIIDYDHPDGTTQHLSESGMAALDRTVFELKRRGIHVILDPWVQRCFTAADGVADYGSLGTRGNFNLHPYVYFDPRMRELIKKTWTQVWTHVNPLTGLAYKDEPAVVMTEVINEGLMQRGKDHVTAEPYRTNFIALYEQWASENGGEPGLGARIISQNWGENTVRFYMAVQRDFYLDMHRHLRAVGVRIPINATNWAAWPWEIAAQADLDFMDGHHYYGGNQIGPGSGLGGLWLEHPPGLRGSPFAAIAGMALPGKPVASSEWGNNPPKEFRAAYPTGTAAIACLQGWDSFTGYAFSQSGDPRDTLSAFEWETDPVSVASMALGALIFRRGGVSPARETVAVTFPDGELGQLHGQNDGARAFRNSVGFNRAIEEHRVVVAASKEVPEALRAERVMTTVEACEQTLEGTDVRSDTGELWRDWRLGIGTVDTPRTQVAYGKLGEAGRPVQTGACVFRIRTPYAVAALTSLTAEPIRESRRLLLVAMARAENTGQASDLARTKIEERGTAPVICEPVEGTVSVNTTRGRLVMYPIAADGTRGRAIPVPFENGTAHLELAPDSRTIFYEVVAE